MKVLTNWIGELIIIVVFIVGVIFSFYLIHNDIEFLPALITGVISGASIGLWITRSQTQKDDADGWTYTSAIIVGISIIINYELNITDSQIGACLAAGMIGLIYVSLNELVHEYEE